MPRVKFYNHKGQSRQFTPIAELKRQVEQDQEESFNNFICINDEASQDQENMNINANMNTNTNTDDKGKKLDGYNEGIFKVSNPKRSTKKLLHFALLCDESKEKQACTIELPVCKFKAKTLTKANADLARLAVVRKERAAAAELRLAAKKEMTPYGTLKTHKSEGNAKKATKSKSPLTECNHFLKKGRNKEYMNNQL